MRKIAIDERGASWKVLLPHITGGEVLALGLDLGQLVSVARTWDNVDHDTIIDQKVLATLPEDVVCSLNMLTPEHIYSERSYDLILFRDGSVLQGGKVSKMLLFLLREGGTIACIGYRSNCLNRLGFEKLGGVTETYSVLPYGNPRVVFPLSDRRVRSRGLQFHRPGRWQARVKICVGSLISNLGFSRHLEKGAVTIVYSDCDSIGRTLRDWLGCRLCLHIKDLILYCGSDNEQRKITALAIIPEKGDLVVKIADTSAGKAALNRESAALTMISALEINDGFHVPQLVMVDEWAGYMVQVQTSLPQWGARQKHKMSKQHLKLLSALAQSSGGIVPFSETSWCHEILALSHSQKFDIDCPLKRMFKKIISPAFQESSVYCHRVHGDFAPWNMSVNKRSLSLWDWENSIADGPIYSDIFYFIIRKRILVGPWSGPVKILKDIRELCYKLKVLADLPTEAGFITSLQIWLVLEYLRNPHQRLIEIAAFLEIHNG